jgi:hypothetical protein
MLGPGFVYLITKIKYLDLLAARLLYIFKSRAYIIDSTFVLSVNSYSRRPCRVREWPPDELAHGPHGEPATLHFRVDFANIVGNGLFSLFHPLYPFDEVRQLLRRDTCSGDICRHLKHSFVWMGRPPGPSENSRKNATGGDLFDANPAMPPPPRAVKMRELSPQSCR